MFQWEKIQNFIGLTKCFKEKLEQLECLTYTIDSYWIQSQSYKFKEFAKISNIWIWEQTLHVTHLLKLLDKMLKYEMDLVSIVEDTEQTRFCPQTDRWTDGQGFVEAGV